MHYSNLTTRPIDESLRTSSFYETIIHPRIYEVTTNQLYLTGNKMDIL
jgi:hypothetical protein